MKERNIAVSVLLVFITCGIYGIFWFISLTDDVVKLSNGKEYSTSGGKAFLFTLITCGIYGFYWAYKMGVSVNEIKRNRGLAPSDNGILYIVLAVCQLQIVNYCLIQSEVNNAIAGNN